MTVMDQAFVCKFDPALYGGRAALSLDPAPQYSGPRLHLHATMYYFTSQPNATITTSTTEIASGHSYNLEIPAPSSSCVIGIRIEQPTSSGNMPLVDFRTLRLPDVYLIDHQGSPDLAAPADLEDFWTRSKQSLAAVPMNTHITHIRDYKNGRLYKIRLDSMGQVPIFGWYFVPLDVDLASAAKQQYPAVQCMPGYGAEEKMHNRAAEGIITFALNPRGHGPSAEHFTLPTDHHHYNIEDLEHYYYRMAFLDCLRGIDFLASRPEINPARIAVEGSSQGAAFALATAALDSRICCVCAHIPTFIDFPDSLRIATAGSAVKTARLITNPAKRGPVLNTISYIDLAFFAKWITCPTLICAGLQDCVCPPLNGIVMHNRISPAVPKKLVLDPAAAHIYSPLMQTESRAWQSRYL